MNDSINLINKEKLVAIIRIESLDLIEEIVTSLYQGGIRIVEVTMNTAGALDAIKEMDKMKKDIIVGAGTVLDPETASKAISAGASFILSPTLCESTIQMGHNRGVPVIPGVMTPTEVLKAFNLGVKTVKIFPVRTLGSDYYKDLQAPLPFLNAMAVGGISLDNAKDFLEKGWNSLGIGSSLVNQKLINEGKFSEIEERAKQFVTIRKSLGY